jgi:hypothetical protein
MPAATMDAELMVRKSGSFQKVPRICSRRQSMLVRFAFGRTADSKDEILLELSMDRIR